MKVAISSLLLLVIGLSYVSSEDSCHMREVDLCLSTGMFMYQSGGVPDDDDKVTEWCETINEVRDCMRNYSVKCLSPVQRELTGLLSGGASSAEGQLCTPGSELRSTYLKHCHCLAEGVESDEFKTNVRDIQVVIENVHEVEFENRLPLICCGARRFHKESEENTRRRCGEEAVDMLKLMLEMIITDLPSTVCQSFDPESDTCKQLLPPSGTTPKGNESKSQVSKLISTVFGN